MTKAKSTNKELDKVLAAQLPVIAPKPARKTAKPLVKAEAKKAAPAKKAPAKKTAEKSGSNPREGSKAEKATQIYLAGQKANKSRAEIIAAFIEHAGLTKAGANTYYANVKKKHS